MVEERPKRKRSATYSGSSPIESDPGIQIGIEIEPPRRRSRAGCALGGCLGAVIVLVIVAATLVGIAAGVLAVAAPNLLNTVFSTITGIETVETRPVPGDVSRFDPVAALSEVAVFAGAEAQLVSMEAWYVRADGTLELTATYSPSPRVAYKFVREVPRPADAPPPGVGGANAGPWYETITVEAFQPGQWRTVTRIGGGVSIRFQYVNEGMTREVSSPAAAQPALAAPPICALADLWQAALRRDAPGDAVAIITYDADGYRFSITGTGVDLRFGRDCQLT